MIKFKLRMAVVGIAASTVAMGCVASPGASVAPTAAQRTAVPAPTSAATPDPSATAVPQEPYDEAEFWDRFGGTEMQSSFKSMDDIVAASDVVVIATVQGVAKGRTIPVPETGETEYMATMTLRIDDVVRGSVNSPTDKPGTMQVETLLSFSPPGTLLDAMIQSAPKGRQVLLFLGNRTADVLRHGLPKTHPAAADDQYFLLTGIEGYVRNVDGVSAVSREADVDWLRALEGRPFTDAAAASRAAAAKS
jgi:hypothetical protein